MSSFCRSNCLLNRTIHLEVLPLLLKRPWITSASSAILLFNFYSPYVSKSCSGNALLRTRFFWIYFLSSIRVLIACMHWHFFMRSNVVKTCFLIQELKLRPLALGIIINHSTAWPTFTHNFYFWCIWFIDLGLQFFSMWDSKRFHNQFDLLILLLFYLMNVGLLYGLGFVCYIWV